MEINEIIEMGEALYERKRELEEDASLSEQGLFEACNALKKLQAKNKQLKEAINHALPSISLAMGNYEEARYIDIEVLYEAIKDKE